jgi:hypothetical protein
MQAARLRRIPVGLALVIALSMIACRQRQSSASAAEIFSTPPKILVTVWLSPTPQPTPAAPNLPTATPVPTLPLPTSVALQPTLPLATIPPPPALPVTPTVEESECPKPPKPFRNVWRDNQTVKEWLGCPQGSPRQIALAFQPFEHGLMLWRGSDRSIFILSQQGDQWWRLDDTFRDGQDSESDPGLIPPEGLLQPVRGFGKVWRQNGFVREALGWATSPETEYVATWQDFEDGWMLTAPGGQTLYVMTPTGEPPYSTGLHLITSD